MALVAQDDIADCAVAVLASRASYDAPDWQLDAWVSTYTAIAAGEVARVTPDVHVLSGHPPTSLAAVVAAR